MGETEKLSKQSIRTKTYLKQAFIELINEKGYSHVTITDIVHKAQYNRTTFYLYYEDKLALTRELQHEMYEKIKNKSMDRYGLGIRMSIEKMHAHSFGLIYYIYENRDYFNLFLKEDTIPGLYQDLPQAIFDVLEQHFDFTVNNADIINSSEYKLYMAHGTAGIILDWIKHDYNSTPDEMSVRLINILRTFAKEFKIISYPEENKRH